MAVDPRSEFPAIAPQILEGCDLYFQYILRIRWIGIAYGTSPASLLLCGGGNRLVQPRRGTISRFPAFAFPADPQTGRRTRRAPLRPSRPKRRAPSSSSSLRICWESEGWET